ncbi:MAG: sporulation protein YabP [Oscillospiraceae bacterium]
MADFELAKMPHSVVVDGRKKLRVTGVNDMESFDEETVTLYTNEGEMIVKGEGLHMIKIDVDSGELSIEGIIYSINYSDTPTIKGGFFSKLFR